MTLNQNFLTQELNGEYYMISTTNTKFNGIVKNNETAGFIINCMKEETTVDNIVEKVIAEYDINDRNKVKEDVIKVIENLREIGAINE